ncbi:MAG: DUF4307 domain-containing protein [Hamadaea sp.]|nr:DUF4307 domain-containing protein [Hamadaea sp.]
MTTDDHLVFPPGRYGRQRAARRTPRTVVALAAAALLVIMTFIGVRLFQSYGKQDYSASVTRFTTAENAVNVEFVVRLPEGGRAACVVRARNEEGAEIGRAVVEVAAGADPTSTVATYRLTTEGRPVTGEVERCSPAETVR